MILVTGGTGYIGSHTVVELLKANHKVVVVDNFQNSTKEVLQRIKTINSTPFEFEEVDVNDVTELERVFSKYPISAVIHFAAHKSVGESVENPLEYYRNNIGSLVALLTVCKKHEVNDIVFSSSCTVYGQPSKIMIDESVAITKAESPYGNTKIISEQIISDFAKMSDCRAVLLRYFNPVGSHESGLLGDDPKGVPNNLIPYLTRVVDGELPHLNVFGGDYQTPDGTCIRDYIHVVDLAMAHVQSIAYVKKLNKGQVDPVNLGTGKGNSVLEVIKAFEEATGKEVPYEIVPKRAGDVVAIYADPAKAKQKLGWEAKLDLTAMMKSAWNFQITDK